VVPSVRHERAAQLRSGTEYRIAIPDDWNGVLVNDLDGAISLHFMSDRAQLFLGHGYAYSGTNRRPDRNHKFDPRAERNEQAELIDLFMAEFAEPARTVQFGCSGGGGVALGMAEAYPDRIDAAISANGADGIVMSNQRLDLLFALKTLLPGAGSLPIVGIGYNEREQVADGWRSVLTQALQTGDGRAKVALSGALAQVPAWGGAFAPFLERPDPGDRTAVQSALLRSTFDAAVYAAGIRHLYDTPAGVMSWNIGIDYEKHYENAHPAHEEVVHQLYDGAGPTAEELIRQDVERINAGPRVEADEDALNYWAERALTGDPRVPVIQVNTVGDATRSAAVLAAYAEGVEAQGRGELYRQALIDAPGHCTFAMPEMGALLSTVLNRLDEGEWADNAEPDQLNLAGRCFGLGEPRFISLNGLPLRDNRAYFRQLPVPKP
jgi:pimeloyl-ACP methyl ester carboxylesterase